MKNVKFRDLPREKEEFRGKFRGSKPPKKTQIPRLGSKFRGPRKLWALQMRSSPVKLIYPNMHDKVEGLFGYSSS